MRKRAVFAVLVCLCLTACQPLENTARDVIAGAQGFIQQAQVNHLAECQANPTKDFPCQTINRAVAAQNLAIDALNVYCGFGKDTPAHTPCAANKSGAASLNAALDNLNRII